MLSRLASVCARPALIASSRVAAARSLSRSAVVHADDPISTGPKEIPERLKLTFVSPTKVCASCTVSLLVHVRLAGRHRTRDALAREAVANWLGCFIAPGAASC